MARRIIAQEEIFLNLNTMLDVFSTLVCFLLINYSTQGASADSRNEHLELPLSETLLSIDSAPSVSITKNELIVQGGYDKPLTIPIVDGDVPEEFLADGQGAILEVYKIFDILQKNNETIRNRAEGFNLTRNDVETLILEADKITKFKLIRRVMLSAQQAQFISWNLAVEKTNLD